MGRTQSSSIDTPSKRAKLAPRKNPYWQGVSGGRGGVSLGYRKPTRGHGTWIAKVVVEGNRVEERLGIADDNGAPFGALAYRAAVSAALDWSQQQHETLERSAAARRSKGPSVKNAVDEYVSRRKTRSEREGKNAEGRLARHVLADEKFASIPLRRLRSSDIEDWRSHLQVKSLDDGDAPAPDEEERPVSIAPATVNRLLNDLRAALNAAAEKHRREMPGSLPAEIKAGTKSLSVESGAKMLLLDDAQIKKVIDAAFEVDGDFGNLILIGAATGARHSQLRSIRVGDVQSDRQRILIPGSRKGRAARQRPPVAYPVAQAVLDRLKPILDGRAVNEPLLMRWAYVLAGALRWQPTSRRAWGPAYEIGKFWSATVEKSGTAKDTSAYALRHSSIVRGLRSGLPVRLVAALHDTSSQMIEKHYAAFIVDATEDLARRAAISI